VKKIKTLGFTQTHQGNQFPWNPFHVFDFAFGESKNSIKGVKGNWFPLRGLGRSPKVFYLRAQMF
jgi:hypothetical protein